MALTTTSREELDQRARAVHRQLSDLLAQVDPETRLAPGDWTARDAAAHLLTVLRRYTDRDITERAGLADSPEGVGRQNREELEAVGRMSMADLRSALDAEMDRYLAWDGALDAVYPFHARTFIDGFGARGNMIGEMLIHGHDVAVAARRDWPIAERDILLVLNGILQVCSAWLHPAAAAKGDVSVVFRFRGGSPQLFAVSNGTLAVRDARSTDRPDAVVSAPPVPTALLMYGRMSLAAAVRRGLLVVGGRRPWKALGVPSLFVPV